MATWKLPQISLVTWTGANGDEVEGVLELPFGHDPQKEGPLPMIIELHGGPTASTQMGFRYWCYGRTIMPANGYALLSPNYRGSTGYGDKFMTELVGHENDIEVRDILAGVEAMIERGIADPERLGVMGWSNGGFLTNGLITQSTRFKAASSGAGIARHAHPVVDRGHAGARDQLHAGPARGRIAGGVHEGRGGGASPIWNLQKVVTPTLIHVGGSDDRVPPGTQPGDLSRPAQVLRRPGDVACLPGPGPRPRQVQHAQGEDGMGLGVVQALHPWRRWGRA